MITTKTRQLCNEIRRKVQNPIKGGPEFSTEKDVLEEAVKLYYEYLKKEKILR